VPFGETEVYMPQVAYTLLCGDSMINGTLFTCIFSWL
jgi:hypothetical protein